MTAAHMKADPLVVDLIAGGGNPKSAMDVGNVSIWNDLNYLYVKYEVVDPWCITETHLHIATSPDLIPQKNGNPIPGHFMYNDEWDPCITEYKYMIPLIWDSDTELYIAAHAAVRRVVGYEPPTMEDFSDVGLECTPIYQRETAWGEGLDFPGRNWATYIPYTVQPYIITFPEEGNAYIGYEDRTGGDFDYNDFGMNMYVLETYANGYLISIHLEFTSVVHLAGDNHDIHIARTFEPTTAYTYTITRDHTAYGTETPASTDTPGTGPFDVILFDSSDPIVVGKTVTIDISITTPTEPYNPTPTPPRWDLDPVFAYYDPWMYDKSYGPYAWHITDLQDTTIFGDPTPGIAVPYIIVVPYTDWPAPGEGTTITTPYPDFDNYYRTQDPIYADWYLP